MTEDATPKSIEAEQSVIGALLLDNDAFDKLCGLDESHFYRGEHRAIFREIAKQILSCKQVDVITVWEVLGTAIPDLLSYLNALSQNTPSSANVARYSRIVQEKAMRRNLIKFGREIEEKSLSSSQDVPEIIEGAFAGLEAISKERAGKEPVLVRNELAGHIEAIESRMTGVKAISSGYPDLDSHLNGGFRGGDLIILAARPKMGKSAMAGNIALNVAGAGHSVLFLSGEMPKAQLHDRNIANLGSVFLPNLLQPQNMQNNDWRGLTIAVQKMDKMNLFLDDQGGLRMMDVRAKAKAVARKAGLQLMVVDYLQLMEGDGDNRNAQIEGITRNMKALAKELDMTIILLSQLNRKLEERGNKRPMASDLRDSGAIEQDADAVIFLYRHDVYDPKTPEKGVCEADVSLCRQGQPGVCYLRFRGEYMRFESMPKGFEPSYDSAVPQFRKSGLAAHL